MPKKCKTCGRNCESDYCFAHKPRKPLPQIQKSASNRDMLDFFFLIWKKRRHVSEVSGDFLGKEPRTVYFHHILPKEKYPQAKHDEDNIILLTLDEHTNVENDMYKYEEVNKRRNLLKTKYNL